MFLVLDIILILLLFIFLLLCLLLLISYVILSHPVNFPPVSLRVSRLIVLAVVVLVLIPPLAHLVLLLLLLILLLPPPRARALEKEKQWKEQVSHFVCLWGIFAKMSSFFFCFFSLVDLLCPQNMFV